MGARSRRDSRTRLLMTSSSHLPTVKTQPSSHFSKSFTRKPAAPLFAQNANLECRVNVLLPGQSDVHDVDCNSSSIPYEITLVDARQVNVPEGRGVNPLKRDMTMSIQPSKLTKWLALHCRYCVCEDPDVADLFISNNGMVCCSATEVEA
ncbi:hypothetical protein RRG08_042520 [Elysia crispata]|uniref:Uncharacterized protein n=1 Tax=Elysia crispata TaxID=231223 RepID=A0AAE0XPX4_9GAST|nr:hypothetical protein RRG08_042520 [Elysia crispata]